jgi:DNA-binding beta-propeller fold protein YncE
MRALRTPLWISWLVFVSLSTAQAKTNYAYVSDNLSTTVTVINTSNNSIVKMT